MSGDESHIVVNEDDAALRERLIRSGTVPEFTMQAVTSGTGVPGDTIRSWQRRYGFPRSSRNDSNYRLFSRQDMEAVTWVRDQTARGQGTKEAIAMLRRIMDEAPTAAPARPSSSPEMPIDTLIKALRDGDMPAAQSAWDGIAIAVSPDALCHDVIIPAHRALQTDERDLAFWLSSNAFLMRKATVLLDLSSPERGHRDAVVLAGGDAATHVPAIALATVLSRSGFRITLPLLDVRDAESVIVVQQLSASTPAIVVSADGKGLSRHLFPNRDVFHWWYDASGSADEGVLPTALADVAEAIQQRMKS